VLRRPIGPTHYLSIRYTERLAETGIEPSVGSKGDSYDNALAESVIGLYKTEVIHRRGPWRGREDVELATLEWAWWFNHHRLWRTTRGRLGGVLRGRPQPRFQLAHPALKPLDLGLHGEEGGPYLRREDLARSHQRFDNAHGPNRRRTDQATPSDD
jgi:hypothetical protein